MSRDYRDAVIETFADTEAALLERVVELTIERDAYRLIAVQAVHALCDRRQQLDRLRAQHHRLQADYRGARTTTMRRNLEAA